MDDWLGLGKLVGNVIDEAFTSDEEKQKLTNELTQITNALKAKELEYKAKELELQGQVIQLQGQVLAAQSQNITAEAKGESWLQRSWRPITMLTFLVLIVLNAFGLLANPLPEKAWELLQLGIGGYVVGRTVEKIAPGTASKAKEVAKSIINSLRNPHGHR
ncbi:3TM-type holin [Pseudoalteromonas byunsanensis]|uniref:Holin of 3TMs, for gene-transfer release n=1 Tax=Pseudoalteromonas byunsanensis TaxID=327939 RepID=A0A1S1NBP3_9GAMM|nr:3TM-type holin [Pseudoalteromonas byunsanensis]OHU97158.1 hypothetical protein BIW53_02230 [Pseudoalteromonas byunsanensis]